ncbi:MAG: hypothetical protein ABI480_12275 [Chitinophagaceae bacterium]
MHLLVMRQLFFSLFLLTASVSYGQQVDLQGIYSAGFIGAEAINFVGTDSFYFNGFYCNYSVYGKGRCEIRNDNLYLYFEKNKPKSKVDTLRAPLISGSENNDSLVNVQIRCVDNMGEPIMFSRVQLALSHSSINMERVLDTTGVTNFSIPRRYFPVIVKTSTIDFDPGKIRLDTAADYTIKLFHRRNAFDDKELNNGEIYVYEIDEFSPDLIMMRPQNSTEKFRQYRKKS